MAVKIPSWEDLRWIRGLLGLFSYSEMGELKNFSLIHK